MANHDQVRTEILDPMRSLFRVPFGVVDPENGLTQYSIVLSRYSSATLADGWKIIIASYKRRDWPTISDLVEAMDSVERDIRRANEDREAADQKPDPWDAFRAKALSFVKRDKRTFEKFRDAGVRVMDREFALAFDSEVEANGISDIYGDALNAFIGFAVELQGPPAVSPSRKWTISKWSKSKEYMS